VAQWGLLVILSILWGGSFLFVEVALSGFDTVTIVFARVSGAAAFLALWIRAVGSGFPSGLRVWSALAVMGVLNNAVPFTLFVLAQGQIEGGLAAILNATTPLWTVLVAHGLTMDERLTLSKGIGLILGFSGVVVIAGRSDGEGLAVLACLGAAISYGFAGVWGKRFKAMGLMPVQVAFGMLASSSLVMAPFWLVLGDHASLGAPNGSAVAALVGLSLLSTSLAYILYFRLLAMAGATILSLVTFLIPITALILGIGLLHEQILPQHFIGFGMILAGLAAIDGRVLAWRG
jgi:drug/metabolite transporter (DMT)-like permease